MSDMEYAIVEARIDVMNDKKLNTVSREVKCNDRTYQIASCLVPA